MWSRSKRSNLNRRSERGATLTGYALAMSAMVVVALGSMALLERTGEDFLIDSGTNIGEPRLTQEELKDVVLPAVPDDGVAGPFGGGGDPGNPGGGTPLPNEPFTAPGPTSGSPFVDQGQLGSNSLAGNGFANKDAVNVFTEGGLKVNSEFEIPGIGVTVPAGTRICVYYLHYTGNLGSGNVHTISPVTVTFPGPIIGFAETNGALDDSDDWNGSATANFAGSRAMENSERATGKNTNTMTYSQLRISANGKDDVRIFVECP